MSWLQFIDSMFGHLAWPLVVLIIAFALRRHLGPLAERVRELTIGPASLKFGDLLEKGSELIEQAPSAAVLEHNLVRKPQSDLDSPELPPPVGESTPPDIDPDATPVPQEKPSTVSTMALWPWSATDREPWNIISEWNQLDMQFSEIGELFDVKTRNGRILMDMLLKRELVSKEAVELFDTLRQARNEAVHGKVTPSEFQVAEFIRQAKFLKDTLTFAIVQLRLIRPERRKSE
jgi:hypothetical protein